MANVKKLYMVPLHGKMAKTYVLNVRKNMNNSVHSKEKVLLVCKTCKVLPLEYNDQGFNSHYKCPKCKKVLFYDGEGDLKLIKIIKKTIIYIKYEY